MALGTLTKVWHWNLLALCFSKKDDSDSQIQRHVQVSLGKKTTAPPNCSKQMAAHAEPGSAGGFFHWEFFLFTPAFAHSQV